MTNVVNVVEYTSDYTGEQRFALKIDGGFPTHLDFRTRAEADIAARKVLQLTAEHGEKMKATAAQAYADWTTRVAGIFTEQPSSDYLEKTSLLVYELIDDIERELLKAYRREADKAAGEAN